MPAALHVLFDPGRHLWSRDYRTRREASGKGADEGSEHTESELATVTPQATDDPFRFQISRQGLASSITSLPYLPHCPSTLLLEQLPQM